MPDYNPYSIENKLKLQQLFCALEFSAINEDIQRRLVKEATAKLIEAFLLSRKAKEDAEMQAALNAPKQTAAPVSEIQSNDQFQKALEKLRSEFKTAITTAREATSKEASNVLKAAGADDKTIKTTQEMIQETYQLEKFSQVAEQFHTTEPEKLKETMLDGTHNEMATHIADAFKALESPKPSDKREEEDEKESYVDFIHLMSTVIFARVMHSKAEQDNVTNFALVAASYRIFALQANVQLARNTYVAIQAFGVSVDITLAQKSEHTAREFIGNRFGFPPTPTQKSKIEELPDGAPSHHSRGG